MSIIYDALKKVETPGRDEDKREPPDKGAPKPRRRKLRYILLISVGAFAAGTLLWFTGHPARLLTKITVLLPAKEGKSAFSGRAAGPPVNMVLDRLSSKLILNGIFFSGDEGYALINNRIVKAGDEIEGAVVRQISAEEVELEFRGSRIKLSTR